jgi:hypothetical protein
MNDCIDVDVPCWTLLDCRKLQEVFQSFRCVAVEHWTTCPAVLLASKQCKGRGREGWSGFGCNWGIRFIKWPFDKTIGFLGTLHLSSQAASFQLGMAKRPPADRVCRSCGSCNCCVMTWVCSRMDTPKPLVPLIALKTLKTCCLSSFAVRSRQHTSLYAMLELGSNPLSQYLWVPGGVLLWKIKGSLVAASS